MCLAIDMQLMRLAEWKQRHGGCQAGIHCDSRDSDSNSVPR